MQLAPQLWTHTLTRCKSTGLYWMHIQMMVSIARVHEKRKVTVAALTRFLLMSARPSKVNIHMTILGSVILPEMVL
jgi:hypothetical protein